MPVFKSYLRQLYTAAKSSGSKGITKTMEELRAMEHE